MAEIPVTLIPLLCVKCQAPVAAKPGEIAWVCAQCRQGLVLDEANGLQPLQIHYHASIPPGQAGLPHWVVGGQVALNRQVYGGGSQAGEAERFWSTERRFVIPAYTCSAQALASAGARFLTQPPTFQDGPLAQFASVTLSAADLPSVAHFLVMTIEAGRKDRLKALAVTVRLGEPALWILPA